MLRFITVPATTLRDKTGLLFLALSMLVPLSAAAQTMSLQNGGTIAVNNGGTWTLHGTTVDLGGTGSTATISETGGGRFADGTLTATRALDAPSSANPAGLGARISTSATLGDVTVTRGHTVQTAPNGNESIRRYYVLSPSQTNSGLDAELTLSYVDAELNGLSESDLTFFQSTDGGSSWSEEGADSRNTSANTVTLGGIASVSRWTLGSESTPLPVELARFDGTQTGPDAVTLRWTTASEQNNAGFRIERAQVDANGSSGKWTEVGSVEGAGTTTNPQSYQFTDELPYAANRVSYRLKQVDTDGTTSLSDPVSVERRAVKQVQLLGTYPNPARQQATVRISLPEAIDASDVRLRLYDVLGRQVRTVSTTVGPGRHTLRLDTDRLTNGVYILRLMVGDAVRTQRLTVVK